MNKKTYAFLALICFVISFSSCVESETTGIDQEWKAYNEQQIKDAIANPELRELISISENGSVYWKNTSFASDDKSASTKITKDKKPYFTDSVVVRYEGWYLNKDGTKYIFDTTENSANAQAGRGFRVGKVIDGWSTMLQNMTEGQEVEVIIPQQLGYGTVASTTIPAYTTLRFKIKLLKIIPDNPGEFN